MWKDPKAIVMVVGTAFLGAGFLLLLWKNDVAHAMTVGALIVPSLGQIGPNVPPVTAIATAVEAQARP